MKRKVNIKSILKSGYKVLIPSVLAFKTSFPEILNTHCLLIGIFMPLDREGGKCGLPSTFLKEQMLMHWDTYLYGCCEDSHTAKDGLRLRWQGHTYLWELHGHTCQSGR